MRPEKIAQMRRNERRFLFILSMIWWFTSCTTWLDVEPENLALEGDLYKSEEDAFASKSGVYHTFGELVEQRFVLGELRGNLVKPGPGAKKYHDIMDVFEHNIQPDNKYVSWEVYYRLINQCNDILEHIHQIPEYDAALPVEYEHQFALEAIFMRCYAYFDLVKNWGDVPYVSAASQDVFQDYNIPPMSADSVLDQLEAQLSLTHEWSLEYWNGTFQYWGHYGEDGWDTESWQREMANYGAVLGLLIEIYLYREKYDKVLEIWEIMARPTNQWNFSHNLTFCGSSEDWFRAIYVGGAENAPPVPWESGNTLNLVYKEEFNQWNIYAMFTSNVPKDGGEYIVKPSAAAIRNWEEDRDITRGERKSWWTDSLSSDRTDSLIWKYIGLDTMGTRREPYVSDGNVIIYKTHNYTLQVAEAYNRLGMSDEAIKLVNEVRISLGIQPVSLTANASMIEIEDMIMKERCMEMAFENQVWYDLVRVAKRRNDPNYLIEKVVANTPADRRDFVRANLERGAANWWQLPYHVDAVARNSKLSQKPGY
jgi:hypothetical protein